MAKKRQETACFIIWNLISKHGYNVECLQSESKTRRDAMEHMSQNVISSSAAIVLADPLIGHALTPQEVAMAYDSYAADYDKLKGWKAAEILALDQARSYYSLRRVVRS